MTTSEVRTFLRELGIQLSVGNLNDLIKGKKAKSNLLVCYEVKGRVTRVACKNSQPIKRCSDCRYLNREAYRGSGTTVCYEMRTDHNGKKVAMQTSEGKKACNKFREDKRFRVAN